MQPLTFKFLRKVSGFTIYSFKSNHITKIQSRNIYFSPFDIKSKDNNIDIKIMTEKTQNTSTDEQNPTIVDGFTAVTEGKATVLFSNKNKNDVFYNPVQQFNRDLSITAIRAWSELFLEDQKERGERNKLLREKNKKKRKNNDTDDIQENKKVINTDREPIAITTSSVENGNDDNGKREQKPFITIMEALSASGLRAIRYAKEIPYIKEVIANDFSASAVANIKRNVENNNVENIVTPNQADANIAMYLKKDTQMSCVDLDPYGTAAPFIDAAVQSVANGGLLLVTCTDLAVLAGNSYPEKCFALYGGTPVWGAGGHESALRLVLNMIATTASKHKRSIEPVLSFSIDFYVRVFVRIRHSPAEVKHLHSKTMIVYRCSGCKAVVPQPLGKSSQFGTKPTRFSNAQGPTVGTHCEHCGSVHHINGPMWGGQLHDKKFISKMLEIQETLDPEVYGTLPRIKGMLTLAQDEIEAPLYFEPDTMAHTLKCTTPPNRHFISALTNAGYEASMTHAKASAIKTNAPTGVIWDILKTWIKDHPINENNKNDNSPGAKILLSELKEKYSFTPTERTKEIEDLKNSKIVRFQVNPTKFWGPKSKASLN